MAQRDRSQGFGFVYVDIGALLAQRDQIKKEFAQPIDTGTSQTANFAKRLESRQSVAPESTPEHQAAVAQIRENLDRLQSLHHKLHAMLEEINTLSGKKKS